MRAVVPLLLLWTGAARADEPTVTVGGRLQSDLRFRVLQDPNEGGPWYAPVEPAPDLVRNQNLLNLKLLAKSGRFRGRLDTDLVLTGYPGTLGSPGQIDTLGDLSNRAVIEPFRIETHALYLEGRDLFVKGLDLRLGQQLVQFGVGDQFNPTNVFNPNDVEDVLLFGDQMANVMARLDYAIGNWTATAVLVPVFKPSLIPSTGPLALTNLARLPFYEEELRWRVASEKVLGETLGFPTVVGSVDIQLPEPSPENMQFGFNLGGTIGSQDVGVMYYNGFADVPVATATHTTQTFDPQCKGAAGVNCIEGLLVNEVTLQYPAIQVVGYNMAGEVNPFFFIKGVAPLGYRIEAAVVFPEEVRTTLTQDEIAFGLITQPAGEYDYGLETPNGKRPVVLASTPYPKWVVGLDYTFGKHVMLNGQWVHGMLDELGAGDNLLQEGYVVRDGGVPEGANCGTPRLPGVEPDPTLPGPGLTCAEETLRARLSDLAVIGTDINFASRAGLLRIFTITDLTGIRTESYDEAKARRVAESYGAFTKEGRSGVLLTELDWNFGNGFDLATGTLIQYGADYTKFGAPETGGSFVYTRGRYAF